MRREERKHVKKRWRWSGVGGFDVPTRTAPTNGWSRTHRTAMLAMPTPPWRSPILRNTVSSRWKRVQSPHTRVIASRYCHFFQKKDTRREKAVRNVSGLIAELGSIARARGSRFEIFFSLTPQRHQQPLRKGVEGKKGRQSRP